MTSAWMRTPLTTACLLAASLSLAHADGFEGVWAKTRAECREQDRPTSRTYISLTEKSTGPIFDQYENHCAIGRVDRSGPTARLSLTCYEFWETFRKRQEPRRTSVRLRVTGPQALAIDGVSYRRCPK